MRYRSHGRPTTRIALGGAVAGLLWLSSAGAAGAVTAPDPLSTLTTVTAPATTTLTQLLGGSATLTLPTSPASVPSPPSLPASPVQPAGPAPTSQHPNSQHPNSQDQHAAGASAQVRAPAGQDRVAVDAAVAQFLGVCVRVPQGMVPVRATIVVLDRDVIAELVHAGVPLAPLVVPCPGSSSATSATSATSAPDSTTSSVPASDASDRGSRPDGATGARSGLPRLLAFTGADLAPTLLLAGGMIGLGIAFLRKARRLALVR